MKLLKEYFHCSYKLRDKSAALLKFLELRWVPPLKYMPMEETRNREINTQIYI